MQNFLKTLAVSFIKALKKTIESKRKNHENLGFANFFGLFEAKSNE